jgi:hypothetical protein
MNTPDDQDYFSQLAATDPGAAEQLHAIARALVECDRQLTARMISHGWRKDDRELASLIIRYHALTGSIGSLYEWISSEEEGEATKGGPRHRNPPDLFSAGLWHTVT